MYFCDADGKELNYETIQVPFISSIINHNDKLGLMMKSSNTGDAQSWDAAGVIKVFTFKNKATVKLLNSINIDVSNNDFLTITFSHEAMNTLIGCGTLKVSLWKLVADTLTVRNIDSQIGRENNYQLVISKPVNLDDIALPYSDGSVAGIGLWGNGDFDDTAQPRDFAFTTYPNLNFIKSDVWNCGRDVIDNVRSKTERLLRTWLFKIPA